MFSFRGIARAAWVWAVGLGTLLAVTGCNGPSEDGSVLLGRDSVIGDPVPIPSGTPPPPGGGSAPEIGPSCSTSDPSRYCLALKYVVYLDSGGAPVVTADEAVSNLAQINNVWSQCGIAFQLERFMPVDPAASGLSFATPTTGELASARRAFVDTKTLLVVTTGPWSGTLGSGAANAWTAMPGSTPYGVVLEQPVGTYPNIIAHELGHYLNLDHYSDRSNVMSAVIYTTSTGLNSSQCSAARSAVAYYWQAMMR